MHRILNLSCLLIFSFVVLHSCSKSDTNNTAVTPTVKPDTLTAGWSKITVDNTAIADVFFSNSTTGYALGSKILKSVDGGISWTKLTTAFANAANLAVTNDGKIFVASPANTMYKSVDGGTSFSSNIFNAPGISDMFFLDNNTGFTATYAGLFQTTDGGVTWPIVTPTNGLTINQNQAYNTFFFLNLTTGWIATGSVIYKTNGNINNWTLCSFTGTPPTSGLFSLFAVSSSVVFAGLTDGTGRVFKSVNGGTTFSQITVFSPGSSGGFLDIHFIDPVAITGITGIGIYKMYIKKST